MGEHVMILDLAKRMIRLSAPQGNIKIEYSGLRHGEKLFKKLLNSAEYSKPTHNDIILIVNVRE